MQPVESPKRPAVHMAPRAASLVVLGEPSLEGGARRVFQNPDAAGKKQAATGPGAEAHLLTGLVRHD